MENELAEKISFDDEGLVPCVVQDWGSGEVLMLAYMNRESLARTVESGETHFWSRSRGQLWRKGETSGNSQRVREIRYDCDIDTLLALVEPEGPACHTGERSCFYRSQAGEPAVATYEALPRLARTLAARHRDLPQGSYTASLLKKGIEKISGKVVEEAAEVVQAASSESDERLAQEAADLIYHLGVILELRGLAFSDAQAVLTERMAENG